MSGYAVIGAQWGDEAKGSIGDWLIELLEIKVVVRFFGGDNAGHTVITGDEAFNEVFKFHLLPCGSTYPNVVNVIGNGVVINPKVLLEELDQMRARGYHVDLRISGSAHVIMLYHLIFDAIEGGKIGTTARGIGPAYEDKTGRRGIRVWDLLDAEKFRQKLADNLAIKNKLLASFYGVPPLSEQNIFDEYLGYANRIRTLICDTSTFLHQAQLDGANILFEGAQGTQLDLDHGDYPFCTSSYPTEGGIDVGTGIRAKLNLVIGVSKAYATRVGKGPFPTELHDEIGEELREIGAEYGTTTGRNRRCGWLDTVLLRYAARINGFDCLAITKLDVLSKRKVIKICYAYNYRGRIVREYTPDMNLEECTPLYEELPGWLVDISKMKTAQDLPAGVMRLLVRIMTLVGLPIYFASVGPRRDQKIDLRLTDLQN